MIKEHNPIDTYRGKLRPAMVTSDTAIGWYFLICLSVGWVAGTILGIAGWVDTLQSYGILPTQLFRLWY